MNKERIDKVWDVYNAFHKKMEGTEISQREAAALSMTQSYFTQKAGENIEKAIRDHAGPF